MGTEHPAYREKLRGAPASDTAVGGSAARAAGAAS